MGKKPGEMKSDRIKRSIDLERSDLGRNIQQLERKAKSSMDWRTQFQQHPMTMIGLAFGGGVLLSALLGENRSSWPEARPGEQGSGYRDSSESRPTQGTSYQKHKALDTWDNIKGAMIGVAATRFRSLLNDAVPGFAEEYRKTEEQKPAAASFLEGSTAE